MAFGRTSTASDPSVLRPRHACRKASTAGRGAPGTPLNAKRRRVVDGTKHANRHSRRIKIFCAKRMRIKKKGGFAFIYIKKASPEVPFTALTSLFLHFVLLCRREKSHVKLMRRPTLLAHPFTACQLEHSDEPSLRRRQQRQRHPRHRARLQSHEVYACRALPWTLLDAAHSRLLGPRRIFGFYTGKTNVIHH